MIVKWMVSRWADAPKRCEFTKETPHFYTNGRTREAKISRYHKFFDTEQEAGDFIAQREEARNQAKRLKVIEDAAPELLSALEHLRKAFVIAVGDNSSFAKEALRPADEAISKANSN